MVSVSPKAENCKLNVVCDALILDDGSRSDTYPTMEVANPSARCEHEASVSKVSDEQVVLFDEQRAFGRRSIGNDCQWVL